MKLFSRDEWVSCEAVIINAIRDIGWKGTPDDFCEGCTSFKIDHVEGCDCCINMFGYPLTENYPKLKNLINKGYVKKRKRQKN